MVVAATAALVERAVSVGAPFALVEGRGAARSLRRAYGHVSRFLAAPNLEAPELLLPLDDPVASVYALDNVVPGSPRWKAARNRIAGALISRGVFPEVRPVLTVATPKAAPPFVVAAAETLGIPGDARWFLTLGRGDALSRAVFHLFPLGSAVPEWVLKFSRVAGYSTPFERDERGLRLAARFGGIVAARAPTLIGRFEVAGLSASVETAAVGETLTRFLIRTRDRKAKLKAVAAVAEWVIDMGERTRCAPGALAFERKRLANEVIPCWTDRGVSAELAATLPAVHGVLQHNDLGCWNIVRNDATFMVLDWESAGEAGLPLWDLLYFLTDAFTHVDGEWDVSRRDAYTARLFRGDAPSSPLLFDWMAKGARAAGVQFEHVGPLATLCWLHHGLSYDTRSAAAAAFAADLPTPPAAAQRIANVWVSDPELNPRWEAFLRHTGATE